MSNNLVILEGSPRKKGNSSVLAAHAGQTAAQLGVNVDTFFLQSLKITPCTACDHCVRTEDLCVFKDDMTEIYQKLLNADAVLFASPIYWFTYSAQLKTAIDRLYGLWNHHHGFLKDKPVGVILVYGDTDLYTSGGINAIHTFETMFRFLKARPVGWVYGTTNDVGDAEKSPDLMESAAQLGRRLAEEIKKA